jgi:hypothetical protein
MSVKTSWNSSVPVEVGKGGTGVSSNTAYAVLCGGTTSTNPVQSIASVGSSGQILTSNGAGALPTFQAVSASGAITTITGNTGGAQSPSSGNFNVVGTGSITIAGTANTETVQLTGLTNHNVLIGAGTATITNVAPSATSGVPLISQGAASDPAFGTAVVAGGGTGVTSTTAYAVLCGGTTSTGALQSVASVGTSGQVLTSNGAGALPTFQASSASANGWVLIQTQTASSSTTLTFTTGISSTYNIYVLQWQNAVASSAAGRLELTVSTNGGSSYITTGYVTGRHTFPYNSATITNTTLTDAFYRSEPISSTAGAGDSGTAFLYNLPTTAYKHCVVDAALLQNSGTYAWVHSVSYNTTSGSAVNALQIGISAGNISTGTFSLYGIAK